MNTPIKQPRILNYYLPARKIVLLDKYERWRKVSEILKVSKEAKLRLEWFIYYQEKGAKTALTCRHFGISRKTFYKWYREFDEDNLYSLFKLQDKSKAPNTKRQRESTVKEEQRIIKLRKDHIRIGKDKLPTYYRHEYKEEISSWKVQKVIEKYQLYYHPAKAKRTAKKRASAKRKKQITELNKQTFWFQKKAGYIICLDTIVIYRNGVKRYIFTAIDKYGKAAFARMYTTKSTINSKDFLLRLYFLLGEKITKVGHDNGSEFKKHFQAVCEELGIAQYHSRPKTPKDNPENERFNRTLQEEFIDLGNFHSDPEVFNKYLTEWLVEYNFIRPHKSLNYRTPMPEGELSPMYPSENPSYQCTCSAPFITS